MDTMNILISQNALLKTSHFKQDGVLKVLKKPIDLKQNMLMSLLLQAAQKACKALLIPVVKTAQA